MSGHVARGLLAITWSVIGVALLASPILDLVLFFASLPARARAWRSKRAAMRAARRLAELEKREGLVRPVGRDERV